MKIIIPLIQYYDAFLESDVGNVVKKSFNENEKLLFQSIISGNIKNDVQASRFLYDGNPSSQTYMKFKQNLYNKLMKMVINHDYDRMNDFQKVKFRFLREWHAVRLLSNMSSTELNTALQKKALLKAERLYLYDIAASVSQALSYDFKVHKKNNREGEFYWEKYQKYKKLEENRVLAKNYLANISKHTRKKHLNKELSEKAREGADFLDNILSKDNVRAHFYYYQLRYLQYILIGDHENVIFYNNQSILYFKPYDNKLSVIGLFKLQLAVSYFNLDYYEKAISLLDEDVKPTNIRWVLHTYLKSRALFLKEKFKEVSINLSIMIEKDTFKQGRPEARLKIWLLKYYADLMVGLKIGKPVETRKIRNNLTRIRSDKKAMNMTFFFAELIQDMLKYGVDTLYKSREKIDVYYNAHIRPSKNKRATLFAKFLRILPDAEYDKSTFKIKLQRIKDAYIKNPIKDVIQPDNEVVNYEILISYILDRFAPKIENTFIDFKKETIQIQEAIV